MTFCFGHWLSAIRRGKIATNWKGQKLESARSNWVFIWAEPISSANLVYFFFQFLLASWAKPNIAAFLFLGHGHFGWAVQVFLFFKDGSTIQMDPNCQVLLVSGSQLWRSFSLDFNLLVNKSATFKWEEIKNTRSTSHNSKNQFDTSYNKDTIAESLCYIII